MKIASAGKMIADTARVLPIGYHCATHGNFKVADTVFAEAKAKDYTREQWEAALDKAKERTEPDAWPLIITDDFF
jgi:hypothetical protein